MKKREEILIQCIEEIKEGRASLEDCLDRYPDLHPDLEPLLRIALSIREPSDIRPSDAFKIRARVNLMEYIHDNPAGNRLSSLSETGVRPGWFIGWTKAVAILVAIILFISVAGTGAAYASQVSLPGDTLYGVKLVSEEFRRAISFDGSAAVALELKFAGNRLDELAAVVRRESDNATAVTGYTGYPILGTITTPLDRLIESSNMPSDNAAIAVAGYERNLNLAITKAEQIMNGQNTIETIALAIISHFSKLDGIEDNVPETVRESVSNAKETVIRGHIRTLQNLSKVNPVRATHINLEVIESRLNRAEAEALKGESKGVEKALQDFEKLWQFGEGISQTAKELGQDTAKVEELIARAASMHLEMLSEVYERAPEQARSAVEMAMQESVRGFERAAEALEKAGTGDIPKRPALPSGVPQEIRDRLISPATPDIPGKAPSVPGRK